MEECGISKCSIFAYFVKGWEHDIWKRKKKRYDVYLTQHFIHDFMFDTVLLFN